MTDAKLPLTVDQQIDLLIRRGMAVSDRTQASHWLRHINYYRLRAYWLPFEQPAVGQAQPQEHGFRAGVSFEQVLSIYEFDRALRLLLLDAIDWLETSLRTQWAHQMALRHGAQAHEQIALHQDRARHERRLHLLREEYLRSDETFALHHRLRYPELATPPIWVSSELLTLGQLSRWIADLRHAADRQAIARAYDLDEVLLISFLYRLSLVRNLCAHHGRVWNREFSTTRMKLPRHKPRQVVEAINLQRPDRLYNALVLLAHVLHRIVPCHDWPRRLRDLMAQATPVMADSMGFPRDWSNLQFWSDLWSDVGA